MDSDSTLEDIHTADADIQTTRDRIRNADYAFSHGSAYPEENGRIRRTPCASCAFTEAPGNVREGTSASHRAHLQRGLRHNRRLQAAAPSAV